MRGERHPDLGAFAAGRDQRQLYARDTRLSGDAPLRFIREGEAERLRAECRAGDLICPVPGCADPRYTTAGGTKRDHFRHRSLAGGVHAPETYFHFTGKHIVGEWARRQHPEAAVNVDDHHVRSDTGVTQVPDVLVKFPDGRRFAFEIQYAPMTIDEWRRRHDGYRQQDIVDIWLWGHERRYLRPARNHADRIQLGPVPFAARRAGVALHWINPEEGLIASCRDASDPWTQQERRHGRRGRPQWESVSLAFEPLADCRIEGDGFVAPLQRYEVEHRVEVAQELLQQRDRQRRKRQEAARVRAEKERRRAERQAYAQAREDARYDGDIRPAVERRLAGALEVINATSQWDRAVYRAPAHWHAKLFELFIEGLIGSTFTFERVLTELIDRLDGRIDEMPGAAYFYLLFLERRGWVACELDDRRLITEVRVLADAAHPPGSAGALPPALPRPNRPADGTDRPRTEEEWSEILGLLS